MRSVSDQFNGHCCPLRIANTATPMPAARTANRFVEIEVGMAIAV